MNFRKKLEQGKKGANFGLPMGIPKLDRAVGGVQRSSIFGIAAGPKGGKTTLVDFCFLINPFLYYLEQLKAGKTINIEWIYFSFEISRVKKEFKLATFFMNHDYGITHFIHKGKKFEISPNYLEGKIKDEDDEPIIIQPEHEAILLKIYEERIIPLFGEFDNEGEQIKKGLITFIEAKENPTGLRNTIGEYSANQGTWKKEKYTHKFTDAKGRSLTEEREKRIGYTPNDPDKYTIIITDHLRKIPKERGFTLKETVDKYIEYQVEFRNWCGFTFVDIIHLNRSMSDTDRIKYMKEFLYPTGDDIKETGNLSEEADYIITMLDPLDEKFNIDKHFGLEIRDSEGFELFPGYRSIHLVESRDTECPVHFRTIMKGNINTFEELPDQAGYGMG